MKRSFSEVVAAAEELPEMKSMPRSQFVGWLAENEQIYNAFRHFALEAIRNRRTRFSAYMIRERVRWYTNVQYGGRFKISNNVTPYMSRLLAWEMPVLDKIFARKEVEESEWETYRATQGDMFNGTI